MKDCYPTKYTHTYVYWLTRLFSVISRTLVGGCVLPLCREAVGVFYSPS